MRPTHGADAMAVVRLIAGREKSVLNRHPWIFSGAVAALDGQAAAGDSVEVRAADGRRLARGTWNPRSQIRARLWTWNPDEPIDADMIHRRVARAVAHRQRMLGGATDAYRLVFSEADGLPGLVADRYGEGVVVQLSSAGMVDRVDAVIEALREEVGPRGIIERSEDDALKREGLRPRRGVLWGDEPAAEVEVTETGLRWLVDLVDGQKTGGYLDQQENHRRVAAYCAGREVLSCFSYVGGFEVHAAVGGATAVLGIDSSAPALALAERNRLRNEVGTQVEWRRANVFEELRRLRDEGRRFDAVILDPPRLVPAQVNLERGLRAYKDLNLQALRLLRPDGILATFSCSGHVSADLFQKVVFGAAVDAGRDVQIVERLGQPADHPVLLSFPESGYLKGLVCRVL